MRTRPVEFPFHSLENSMYRFIYCLLLSITLPAQAQEAAAPLTLAAALQLAETGNPALSAARHELAAQDRKSTRLNSSHWE